MANPQAVLDVASSYALKHYKESSNNGNIFGQWYGLDHEPWCAMFVSYCFNKAGAGQCLPQPRGFASCVVGYSFFKGHNRMVDAMHAKPGDVVFFNFKHGRVPEHVGLVVKNDPMNRVLHTVEGNTSNPNTGSQVNGEGVYFKTRAYSFVVGVAHPTW